MAARKPLEAAPASRARRPLKSEEEAPEKVSYFVSGADKDNLKFISSGAAIIDAALSGGWPLGRVSNIVGDRSAGKTLLAMEAAANFLRDYPNGWVRYAETEAAFDREYAEALGIPIDRIIFNEKGAIVDTVEQWYDDALKHLDENKDKPGLYILDSLDALSDAAELGREFDEGSYGGTKPKQIGKFFRLLVNRFESQDAHLMVISQLRDKLNVTFGETKTRSGGKALDFYCTHIVWLAEIEKLKRTITHVERIIGVRVEAYVKKNKVGFPFRRARYPVLFGYGIDDLTANVEWFFDNKREELLLKHFDMTKAGYKVRLQALRDKSPAEVKAFRESIANVLLTEWAKIETAFLPKSKKY